LTGQNWIPCAWTDGEIVDLRNLLPDNAGLFVQEVGAVASSGRLICNAARIGYPLAVVFDGLPPVLGDTNCDAQTDADDIINVILYWGQSGVTADVTHDGVVNVEDLVLVLEAWTA
jgi:hypothetical protein